MKVVHLNDTTAIKGGVSVYIRDLLPFLRAAGVDARWAEIARFGDEVRISSQDGAWDWAGPVSELSRSPLAAFVDADTLIDVHSLSEPAILEHLFPMAPVVRHMHDQRFFCPGQGKFWRRTETICTRPFGPHCVFHAYAQHCCNRHPKRLWHQYANTRYERDVASRRYATMIANSTYTKAEAVQVGYPEHKIVVMNIPTEKTPEPDWDAPQPPVIVFAGRLSRTKGVHLLLEAFARVCRHLPKARLEILGSGHDEALFHSQAAALGLGDAVRFLGWADKGTIDTHLSGAAVVAFPSIYPEAFGITGIEAMMRGKPVVAFDVGGVSDWLEPGRTGLFAERTDAPAFAAALLHVLGDSAYRRTLGQHARQAAMQDFSWELHIGRLLGVYRGALGA